VKSYTQQRRLRTRSEGGTLALGETLLELLPPATGRGRLVVLRGALGMGKTVLVRGIAAALGVAPEEVSSPTFTLVQEYRPAQPGKKTRLLHLDLYRLETERALESVGLWEMAESPDALLLVEWGDKFAGVLERADAEIAFEAGEAENERLLLVRW